MTLSDIAQVPHGVWVGVGSVLGLVFGSFVTALSYRLPRRLDFVKARSMCTACSTTLTPRDLIPVFSWVLNRGACRACGTKVSVRYPLTELTTALVFASAFWREDRLLDLGLLLTVAVVMMTLVVIDLETRRLPLSLLAMLAVVCVVVRWRADGEMVQAGLIASGIVVLGLAVAAATRALLKSPIVGAGDTYALAIAALVLPWQAYGIFLGLAGGLGLGLGLCWRMMQRQKMFPFAPALFAALWVTVLWQNELLGLLV